MDGRFNSADEIADDAKACTMHHPSTAIATIAQAPDFYITTALLWIRTSERRRASTKLFASEDDARLRTIDLNEAINALSPDDADVEIKDNKPDLGLLHLHRDRLAAAAEALGWRNLPALEHTNESLALLRREINKHLDSLSSVPASTLENRKIRIQIDKTGQISIDSSIISRHPPLSSTSLLSAPFMPGSFDESPSQATEVCNVYLDRQPTRPSAFSTHKTTHRCIYTRARERVDISQFTQPTSEEVLLYNPYGEIMETSCCTIYFKRDGHWITPAAICGPNLGVTRRLAVEKGLCKQDTIEIRELQTDEELWLSNAVRGFFRGILRTDPEKLPGNAAGKEIPVGQSSPEHTFKQAAVGFSRTLKHIG